MPTRVQLGASKSAVKFQKCVLPCFRALRERTTAWLDDFLLHAHSEAERCATLCGFLLICKARCLVVSLVKIYFFLREVVWCGRRIDTDGVHFHFQSVEGHSNLPSTQIFGELFLHVHAVGWVAYRLPSFCKMILPSEQSFENSIKPCRRLPEQT